MIRVSPQIPLALALGWLGLSLLPSACSLTVDAGRSQCRSETDCTAGANALAAARCSDGLCEARQEWSCVDAPAAEPERASTSVDVALPVVDLLPRQAGAALEASLCRKLDVNCDAPTQVMSMSGSGEYTLELDSGFDGYLSVRGESVVPTLYFLSPPLQPGERLPTLTLLSESLMSSLAAQLDVPLIEERGLALFSIQDCDGLFSSGVAFEAREADASTIRFYNFDGLPAVPALVTGTEGSGGFLNVPAGPLTVEARLPDGTTPLASASVWVRPGFISYGRLRPALASESGF
jgi:hypothetical protein